MPRLSKIGEASTNAFGFQGPNTINANYLIVAGGGAGGNNGAGGGGAGGLLTGATSLQLTSSYTIIVGAGGTVTSAAAYSGSNSQFGTLTASIGGGAGGSLVGNGVSGGSGGGGGSGYASPNTFGTGASGTPGQGNTGGNGYNLGTSNPPNIGGGGGGGAGGIGSNGANTIGGTGGAGTASSISGTSTYYAGGGGGGSGTNTVSGGTGGGGTGGGGSTAAAAGGANTGGGGGGGGNPATTGGQGGSGIVIISYTSAYPVFGGGVVTQSGGNIIHTFYSSGTLIPTNYLTASYLIVGGGGAGGVYGGGGGGGGVVTGTTIVDPNSSYLVTVGAGGLGSSSRTVGGNIGYLGSTSSFNGVTAGIGGPGGSDNSSTYNVNISVGAGGGATNGSGGGGAYISNSPGGPGSGTGGAGSAGTNTSPGYGGGGGGGAGGNASSSSSTAGGNGGVGVSSSITGVATYYGGGGGGGAQSTNTRGTGGNGGGGTGGNSPTTATSGTVNTGGGGGGDGSGSTAGSGGSGVVIISYPGTTQLMAGGTVSVANNTVIHTFNNTGYLSPLKTLNNSLRFRAAAGAYLSRTPTTAGNQKTWTASFWCKRTALGANQDILNPYYGGDGTNESQMYFRSDDTFQVYDSGGVSGYMNYITTQLFRDPAAWYHIVVACDTTQANAANRLKIYVNGVQVTSFSTSQTANQNNNTGWNGISLHKIGSYARNTTQYFDGYLSEFNFVDGLALGANAFGAQNQYGQWQPIAYRGSYGTNGFYLPFTASSSNSYAGSFNGSSQYLTLTSTSALQVASSTPFTLECFVNFNNFTATTQNPSIIAFPGGYQLYVNTSGVVSFYNGTSDLVTGTISTFVWNHIAVSRDASGNLAMWINGKQSKYATGFTSGFGASSGTFYINSYNGSGGFVSGLVSNVRFVNGTAVYNPNSVTITVPTSNLTAVANTTLLTLQGATIVDNSTSAYSITNNGTATTSVQYPFTSTIFNDQSSNLNTWTPSSIVTQSGTNFDSMYDVPTLTSTSVANYATLNPLSYPGLSSYLTRGNLSLSGQDQQWAMATIGVNSGKWYWEVYVESNTYPAYLGVINAPFRKDNPDTSPGINAASMTSYIGGLNSGTTGYYKNYTAGSSSSQTGLVQNKTWGFALDLTAGTLNYYVDNSLVHTDSTLPTDNSTYFFPMVGQTNSGSNSWTRSWFNFGQQPFAFTPPSGYKVLNTYNLP